MPWIDYGGYGSSYQRQTTPGTPQLQMPSTPFTTNEQKLPHQMNQYTPNQGQSNQQSSGRDACDIEMCESDTQSLQTLNTQLRTLTLSQ